MSDDYIDVDGYDLHMSGSISGKAAHGRRPDQSEEDVEYATLPRVDDLDGFNRVLNMADMIRLDADIFDWLLSGGLDYEARANAILRRQMILERGLLPPDIK